jgi:hypothetical protein
MEVGMPARLMPMDWWHDEAFRTRIFAKQFFGPCNWSTSSMTWEPAAIELVQQQLGHHAKELGSVVDHA